MKKLTNKMIVIVAVLLISLIIVMIGYMQYNQGRADSAITSEMIGQALRYNLSSGDSYGYHIVYTIENPADSVSIDSTILVTDRQGSEIRLNTMADTMQEGNMTKSDFNRTIDELGLMADSDVTDILIPQIQPELPNRLVYAEKEMRSNDTWTMPIVKNGNYNNSESTTTYDIIGTSNYTCTGLKTIDTGAGKFICAEIRSETSYTLNVTVNTINGTVHTITNGSMAGVDWVDLEKGFLVKSEYDVNKLTSYDLSDIFNKANTFSMVYREVPATSHITVVLNSIREG